MTQAAQTQYDLSGQRIGERYTVLEPIGRGGMSAVYRGRHDALHKSVAIKVLHGELVDDVEAVARFHREALAIARLKHPHIVRIDDFGTTPSGAPYIVMEHLRGEPLAALIARRGALPARTASAIVLQVLDALAAAHTEGIVHRDLTSANIFLDETSDGVKLLDFGISKLIGPRADQSERLTTTGTVLGTPYYLAPEQARGAREADPRTDIYSLGVVLYEMLTGELPFRGRGLIEVLNKHRHEPPVPPRSRRPDLRIPADLEQLVLRALRKDPAERFPSASAMRQALDALSVVETERQPRRRWWPWAVAGLALVGLLLGAASLLVRRAPRASSPSLAPTAIDRPQPPPPKTTSPPDPAVKEATVPLPVPPATADRPPSPSQPGAAAGHRPVERGRRRRRPKAGRSTARTPAGQPAVRRGEIEDNPYR